MSEHETICRRIKFGEFNLAKMLVTNENVNSISGGGTILFFCCLCPENNELVEFVKWILSNFDINLHQNVRRERHGPALAFACFMRKFRLVELLVGAGANVNCNIYDHPATCYLVQDCQYVLAEMMISKGAKFHEVSCCELPSREIYVNHRNALKNTVVSWILVIHSSNVRRIIGKDMIRLVAEAIWSERMHLKK